MSGRITDFQDRISRRGLLIGGGAGIGLIVAWAAWPRRYAPNLVAAPGETIFGAWLKIGEDGHVTVAVPQAEMGQGVFTVFPQIVADELGADWRTIAVEPAPINALYANRLFARALVSGAAGDLAAEMAVRQSQMVTAGSTSLRAFEAPLRQAGAAARNLLQKAAAARWDIDWRTCDTRAGFVVADKRSLRFGALAAEAATFDAADPSPLREGGEDRLTGQSPPRLDIPSKIDGSANFAADVRLPGMVFAAVRQGPIGRSRLLSVNKAAAERMSGVIAVVETAHWVAAVGTNWWAANRALDALAPRFETRGAVIDDRHVDVALGRALDGPGHRIVEQGDLAAAFRGQAIRTATYDIGPAQHAAIEPLTATASWDGDMLELWAPTQAPEAARREAAAAIGVGEARVSVHPMLIGGSFGRALDNDAVAQVAILAKRIGKPVQLVWSRAEELAHDRFRPAARARLSAKLGAAGRIEGWQAKIASEPWGLALHERIASGGIAAATLAPRADPLATSGAVPPYALGPFAIDHHPADTGLPAGYWRGGGDAACAFFTECFIDELAQVAGIDPFSYRMGMLAAQPRLARCLSTVTALGGWQGGAPGTGQGIACHASRGSFVAVLADARIDGDRIVVDRLVAVADVGRMIHPDIVRQQIEGGLIFGLAGALAAPVTIDRGLASPRRIAEIGLPRLADAPEITIELIRSMAASGGASEVAVPPVASAIANAVVAASGQRLRRLPLRTGG